jgi:glutathionyl-hydroquinone reductase
MSKDGAFKRDTTYLDGQITVDGRDGWPVEAGRYRLVVARGCPWANRTMIVRRLLGLEQALSMGICGPTHDWRSWEFDLDPGEKDPVLGIHWLREAYEQAVPGYDRGVTVPAIVDIPSGAVVTSDFRHITRNLETEWAAYHRAGAPDLYPEGLREEIEEVSAPIYTDVNNGVYACGFAKTQQAYDEAYQKLFARLDWLGE